MTKSSYEYWAGRWDGAAEPAAEPPATPEQAAAVLGPVVRRASLEEALEGMARADAERARMDRVAGN
jgi:hypothetical protein